MYKYSKDFVKSMLGELRIEPQKAFGQNFLITESIAEKMVEYLNLREEDNIVEIGGGLGALSFKLAKTGKNIQVLDTEYGFVQNLQKRLKKFSNARVTRCDALSFCSKSDFKLIGSLPYSITSRIFRHFLYECAVLPKTMVFLIQDEVAKRIAENKGKMSLLSLSVQLKADIELLDMVLPKSFFPEPEVSSRIIRLVPNKRDPEGCEKVLKLAKIGFTHKRKTLQNNLKSSHLDPEKVAIAMSKLGFRSKVRAQELGIEDWEMLFGELNTTK